VCIELCRFEVIHAILADFAVFDSFFLDKIIKAIDDKKAVYLLIFFIYYRISKEIYVHFFFLGGLVFNGNHFDFIILVIIGGFHLLPLVLEEGEGEIEGNC